MTRRIVLPALAALALAGCGTGGQGNRDGNTEAEANATGAAGNAADAGNATAAVLAMNDRQRNVVFVRALLDAGLDCQGVASSVRLPDQDGKPLWRANCTNNTAHMISITPDGTANIVSRTDR
ncbi:hypothetical protein MZO42_00190 [Sphingomonas psychrotolerans]|uniref:Lipoprotein n=1 Tax=Sphingomonas psychrotolerans TaxID=1327635 RepID=A0ABU3MZR1_9SPHN|nr:hypothetical protein [Sphingomonas psychrotolerans]MDT8757104.1 hypothetical protein [Sphingomonas psychrotolerans]